MSLHAITQEVVKTSLDAGFIIHTPVAYVVDDSVVVLDATTGSQHSYAAAIRAAQKGHPVVVVDPSADTAPDWFTTNAVAVPEAWIDYTPTTTEGNNMIASLSRISDYLLGPKNPKAHTSDPDPLDFSDPRNW